MLRSPGMNTVVMVLLSVINLRISAGQQCTDAVNVTEALDCDFRNGSMCGWQNVSGNYVSHHWIFESGLTLRFQGNESNTTKARIKSQLICATDTDQYLLRFMYKMQYENLCRLTIFITRKNDTNFTEIWSNADKIENLTWESVKISNPSHAFKLLFQAKKLTASRFCEIVLEQTKFQRNVSLSTTPFTPTSTTYLPAIREEVEEGGLSGGGIAGIIVALILVVALCVFIFLLIRRRNAGGAIPVPGFLKRLQKSKQPNSKSAADTASVNNSAHAEDGQRYTTTTTGNKPQISGPMRVEAPHLGPGFEWKSQSSEDDVMESSNYYSMPVDVDGNCVPMAHVNERTKRGTADYVVAVRPESDGGYCTPDDVDVKDSKSRAQGGAQRANAAGGGGSNYNKLSLQTPQGGYPKTKNTDTYSHIQEQDNVYKVPRSGAGSVYSLATNPEESDGRPSARANAVVKGKGATAAPSERADYHHLNLKDGRSATPDASRGQGQKGGVYSHLSNQGETGDNYNRVEFDKRTQRKQSAQCDEPYNHLSGNQV